MKRILIINDLLDGGGVEKLMQDLVRAWHARYEITVLTEDYQEGFENIYPDNVRYITSKPKQTFKGSLFKKCVNKVYKKMYSRWFDIQTKEGNFDVILCMKDGWPMKNYSYLKAPLRYGWIHTDYKSYHYTYDIFGGLEQEKKVMQSYTGIVCVSQQVKRSIQDVLGDPGNLIVKYNPINAANILIKAEEPVVDIDLSADPGRVRFVCVGRLNYQKGYDMLLEACHMLELEGYSFDVWIIGGEEKWSDEHNRLYRTAKRLEIKSVKFLGKRKNPYKYMKYADWFLSTSIFEGYSLVSQEASILGIPLLLTQCSGVKELVGNDEYGLTMEPSVFGIYQGMRRVMESPELREYYKGKILERRQTITYTERLDSIEKLFQ